MKKFLVFFISVLTMLSISSCSSFTTKEKVVYDGMCAMGVSKGQCDVRGKKQYQVTYKKKTYFFYDAKARDSFISKIDRNIAKADSSWQAHSREALNRRN